MLKKLQSILKRGGAVTVDNVARELDTPPELVHGMLEHLARTGWLRQMSASCDTTCSDCLFARDCGRKSGPEYQGSLWQLRD